MDELITRALNEAGEKTLVRDLSWCGVFNGANGVCGVSAPVLSQSGEMKAALTIVTPTERFGPDEMSRYAALVSEAAASISGHLGHSPPIKREEGREPPTC